MLPGSSDKPAFPLNILADFAGGGLICAMGILLALIERQKSGLGQVVSTDMVSGTRYLSSYPLITAMSPPPTTLFPGPNFPPSPPVTSTTPTTRMQNLIDGGAPYFNVYTCADGRWVSIGCLEPQFFKTFLDKFMFTLPKEYVQQAEWVPTLKGQYSTKDWPKMSKFFEKGFRLYDRDHWVTVFHGVFSSVVPGASR